MESEPTWGVDLSSYALRAVKLEVGEGGRPCIKAWDMVDFTEEVEDLSDLGRFHMISRALFHFASRHKLRNSRVYVSIRGETAFNRTVTIPPVDDESLDRLLEYEAQQQIPFPLEDVYWDHRVIAIKPDRQIQATIYAVRRNLVDERLRRLERSRFPADGVQIRPLALHNFCAFEHYLEEGTIVISADYGCLQILICHDDHSWFRCLPIGGVDFVQKIQETFKVDHKRAVKMALGEVRIADPDRFRACGEAAGSSIVSEAARVVRYYLAARPDVKPQRVIFFGLHPCVPPIVSRLKEELALPVLRPKGFRRISVDSQVVTVGIQQHFHALAPAAGLALQGIGKAEVDVRFFPAGRRRILYGGRRGYVAAAMLLLAFVLYLSFSWSARAHRLHQESAALQSQISTFPTLRQVRQEYSTKRIRQTLEALASPGAKRTSWLPFVNGIYRELSQFADGAASAVPLLVAMKFGEGSGLQPRQAEVVLATVESTEAKRSRALLQSLVGRLQKAKVVQSFRALSSWVAGGSTAVPPKKPPERPFRVRLLHVRFLIELPSETLE